MTKEDRKEYNKKQYELNRDKALKRAKKRYENKLDEIKIYKKNYAKLNSKKIKDKQKKYREENKDKIKQKRKLYYNLNKDKIKEKSKNYRKSNKEKTRIKDKIYQQSNRQKINANKRKYKSNRVKKDPIFRLTLNISSLVRSIFKSSGIKKKTKTTQIIGCSYKEFKEHIEKQFEPWMNWNNYGIYKPNGERTWQIDHIIPNKLAKTEEEIIKLNHYSNLRPLCAKENSDRRKDFL